MVISEETLRARSLFGQRLNKLLRSRDMNQNELAKILDVSESTVGKWVLGKSMPRTMGLIQKLADHFGVGKSYFLEHESAPAPEPAPDLSPHDIALIEAYHNASNEIQDIVDNTLDRYSKHNLPAMGKENRGKKEEAVG